MTSAPTETSVAARTKLVAGRDIVIQAESNHSTAADAKSVGGGAFAVKVAETTSRLNADTRTSIGNGANLNATGNITILSAVRFNGTSNSETYSVALGSFADSDNTNSDRGVDIDSPATVNIGKGSFISGDTVSLRAAILSAKANARAWAESYSPVLLGVATAFADASANVDASAKVIIDANPVGTSLQTQVIGASGVDIQADKPSVNEIVRDPHAQAVALIPPQRSRPLGSTNLSGIIQANADATIAAGQRQPGTPLTTKNTLPQLALFVSAADTTTWDANVVLTGTKPELIVDANGQITRQRNVDATVNAAAGTVTITSVTNSGPGQVLFEGGKKVAGNASNFTFQATSPSIDIVSSKYTLVVGNLSAISQSSGIEPKVTFDVPEVAMEFDVIQDYLPPTFNIRNLDSQPTGGVGILLTGLIDNPSGWVRLSTSGGSIVSQNFSARQGAIRANRVALTSADDIGGVQPGLQDRIPIDFVEGINLPAYATINAANDLYLGIQALRRGLSSDLFTALSDPLGSQFTAGASADIMLLAGIDQRQIDASAISGIQVFETARVTTPQVAPAPTSPARSPRTTPVTNHFRVSTTGSVTQPTVLYATGSTPLDVTYNLGTVNGQSQINIYKSTSTSSTVNIISRIGYPGATIPYVDANTNGFIKFDEISAGLAVGNITSTSNDVSLSSTGSIVDRFLDAGADVTGRSITLVANASIGLTNDLQVNSSASSPGVMNASASDNIRLAEVDDAVPAVADDLRVGLIQSSLGDVTLSAAAGAIIEAINDADADVIGNAIALNAISIGQVGNHLEIDSSSSALAGLSAATSGNIQITETNQQLYIVRVASTAGNVALTVRDSSSSDNDLEVQSNISGAWVEGPLRVKISSWSLVMTSCCQTLVRSKPPTPYQFRSIRRAMTPITLAARSR